MVLAAATLRARRRENRKRQVSASVVNAASTNLIVQALANDIGLFGYAEDSISFFTVPSSAHFLPVIKCLFSGLPVLHQGPMVSFVDVNRPDASNLKQRDGLLAENGWLGRRGNCRMRQSDQEAA